MRKTALAIGLVFFISACATLSRDYHLGAQAEINRNYEEAVSYYQKAALEYPKEPAYRVALARAKAMASLYYLQAARLFVAQGNKPAALDAYSKARSFDPASRVIRQEMVRLQQGAETAAEPHEEAMQTPIHLEASREKFNLSFRTPVSLKSMFTSLGRMAGVNFIFDEQFRDISLAADLSGKDLEEAVAFLCAASRNFYRVIDGRTILVAPDNVQKRQQYELNVIKTFYLSNINVQDVQQQLTALMRSQYRVPNIQVDKNLNALTVRDTQAVVETIGRLLRKWDKPRGEVLVDVEIMEVSRQKLQRLGVDLSQGTISTDYSQNSIGFRLNPVQGGTESGWFRVTGINLGDLANYEMTVPMALIQFLTSDSDTRIIAQPRLRGIGGEEISYLVGQKVPIPQATFTPIAAGGVNTQPIVNYTQQDVGIEIKLKPRLHYEKEVTLEVEIKISAITGAGIANIPIISTREVKNVIRLKDGETNLLAGLLKDEERKSVRGIPGLKDLPFLGTLFSTTDTVIDKTDVVLTLTPYIIRPFEVSEEDRKPLWVEPEGLSGLAGGRVEPPVAEEERPVMEAPEPPDMSSANSVYLTPASFEIPREGGEFRVSVELSAEREVANASVNISFNPQLVRLKEIVEGGLIRQLGEKVPFFKTSSGGGCTIGFTSPDIGRGFKGQGTLAWLVFEPLQAGETEVIVSGVAALGVDGRPVKLDSSGSRFVIR